MRLNGIAGGRLFDEGKVTFIVAEAIAGLATMVEKWTLPFRWALWLVLLFLRYRVDDVLRTSWFFDERCVRLEVDKSLELLLLETWFTDPSAVSPSMREKTVPKCLHSRML